MNKILILIIATLCFSSCNNKEKNCSLMYCQPEIEIEEYPDSSFFSNITCMTYYKNKIYVLDKKRGDIVALSDNLKEMEYVSKHGEAPYETTWPFTFNVLDDTVYVVDFGTRSMKKFHKGVFYGDFLLSNANENRFSLNDSLIFLSANTDSTSFLMIDKYHPDQQTPMGKVVREKTPFKTIISNKKHILYDKDKGIFSVSDCYPYIEQYNIHGEYIKTFDISSIPIIKEAMAIAEKNSNKENTVYVYICDAYLANDHIYILCSSRSSSGDYRVNTILKLSINDEMKHISTYILPHDIYSSFCVSEPYLFASQQVAEVTIEKIKIGDEKSNTE
ncbi:hypothetical protein [Bacteroides hominis]|uniref:hypothetical protein n=1 Tax=Bacteroides hominis TaxID=2763023 RepID=UPI003D6C0A28